MRDLRYGIEIEMTGLSRGKAAETLAGFFGTRAEHTGGSYDANPASIEIKPGETTEATFYLKDDDTIHIENLPYGVEYKVSETPVADYVTTETGTEGEVDAAVEQANFTNTKGGTVDAGVVLDSAPYLFTLTGAAGVGLLLTLRRRHQK